MVRLNITMPQDLVKQLKHVRNKSRFIAQALREKFRKEERKKLDRLMVEGYKAMSEEDKALNKEWEGATSEAGGE